MPSKEPKVMSRDHHGGRATAADGADESWGQPSPHPPHVQQPPHNGEQRLLNGPLSHQLAYLNKEVEKLMEKDLQT